MKKQESKRSYNNDASCLLQKLISTFLLNIWKNTETSIASSYSLSSTSSFSLSLDIKEWWLDDLMVLSPTIIVNIMRDLNAHKSDHKNFLLTKFLLHYLNSVGQKLECYHHECNEISDIIVKQVVLMERGGLSCRRLFWILRVVSSFLGLSTSSRMKLEDMIGERLDEATLDDILILGHDNEVYDVNLVIRLVKIFVRSKEVEASLKRMKKVGALMDKYLKEISADKRLNVSKFVEVAESLPNASRECFDGVYKALDIYMEAHPTLSFDERNVLCRCLNCEKLTAEVSTDIARNPKIPPEVSMKALASQLSKLKKGEDRNGVFDQNAGSSLVESANEEKKEFILNFRMTPWRLCRDVRGNISKKIVNRSKMISYNAGELTNVG